MSEAKPLSIDDLVAFHMAGEGVKGLRFPKGLRYYAVSLRTWVQADSAREAVAQVVSNIRSNDPLVDELLGFSVTYGVIDPEYPARGPVLREETFYLKDVKEG